MEIFNVVKSWFSLLPDITFSNILEIIILAFIIYEVLLLVKNSHAVTLLKGILVIIVFIILSALLQLDNILYILQNISTAAVIALVVIFQPELRKGLETIGKQSIVAKFVNIESKENEGMSDRTCKEISKAIFEMAKVKTGALIVIENAENLNDYVNTGIAIDGIVSAALLINIFEKNTPLHDGAVIIKGNKVVSATCYLPLSENESISKDLGTRHRAAIGMSEATDTTVLVVSEETGHISVAKDGHLSKIMSYEQLISILSVLTGELKQKQKEEKKLDEKHKAVDKGNALSTEGFELKQKGEHHGKD